MLQTDSRVVGPGEHDFGVEGLERREKVEIRRRSRRVDRVSALVGEALRRRRTGRKIAFPVLQPVILAEGSLEQADAALERQRRPARHAVDRPFDGQVGNGEIEVFDHLLHHHLARIAALFEEQRVAGVDRTVDPGHVAVEVDQRAVGVSPEETGFGLVKLFVGGIVPVVVLFGIDQQFVGRSDQVVGPVPVRTDEKRRRVERHFGERNQRTVADGSHAAEVGRNLEHLVGAGAVVHESAVFTPGVVFRAGDGVEPRGSHLEAQ